MADKLTKREVLELVRDCSSQEWQQPDGKRMAATDNQGRRMWFITEDIMQAVRASIGDTPAPQSTEGGAPGSTDAERAAWLADKIGALGDYAKEAAAMLRRWPTSGVAPSEEAQRREELSRTGHGHVVPRTDGAKARCGGVMFCDKCKYEREYIDAARGVKGPDHG